MSVVMVCLSILSYDLYADIESIKKSPNMVEVAIVGSGAAGLAAALYTARGGMRTYIFAGPQPGGQLTESSAVENIPGFEKMPGFDVMERKRAHVVSFGVIYVQETVIEADFTRWPFLLKLSNGDSVHAMSIIIATGSQPRFLNVPGEADFKGGNGVVTCAVCDAPFYEGNDVTVVGGGDSAIESVKFLLPYARSITLLHRSDQLRAAPTLRKYLEDSKVVVHLHKRVIEVIGDDFITRLMVEDTITGERSPVPTQGMFLAIGHDPNTQLFKDQLLIDAQGYIILSGKDQRTSVPGVFAAGEVVDHVYRQAIVAEGDGAKAGLDAIRFLHKLGLNDQARDSMQWYHYAG